MKKHTSFKIGGDADVFCCPESIYQFAVLVSYAIKTHIPYLVIGKGSNLLISDSGIRGMVLSTERLNHITHRDDTVYATTGCSLKSVCDYAAQYGLSGLEFACGIPGSLGGAVYMNAGAYEGEISMVLESSRCFSIQDISGSYPLNIIRLNNHQHQFSYRKSILQTDKLIHLLSIFRLKYDDPEAILDRMAKLDEMRQDKQPLDLPSAGSVFKRPQGHFTGKLIDDCGLRGFRIGDAMISNKHCGFIVNLGNATAADVVNLIEYTKSTVLSKYGVNLEPEIRLIGDK